MRIKTKCEVINSLDLTPMIERISDPKDPLTHTTGWPKAIAEEVAEKYRAFLYLRKAYPGEYILPFKALDEMWHQHILFTKKYHDDCMAVFGYYLHHSPEKESTATADFYKKWDARTRELLKLEFPHIV